MVWLSPGGSGGFTSISRDSEMCPGFPPPQAALVTVTSGEMGLWVVWCNSGEVRFKERGKEICIDRIQICVRIIDVWLWALILSLWNGDSYPSYQGRNKSHFSYFTLICK